ESTVCFQRKRGLPSSRLTKAEQVCLVVHWEFCCDWCALTTCLSAAFRAFSTIFCSLLKCRKYQIVWWN
ncbi:hypothetical protein CG399_02065, partial [Bifidobacteriaceae bacterium NR015]